MFRLCYESVYPPSATSAPSVCKNEYSKQIVPHAFPAPGVHAKHCASSRDQRTLALYLLLFTYPLVRMRRSRAGISARGSAGEPAALEIGSGLWTVESGQFSGGPCRPSWRTFGGIGAYGSRHIVPDCPSAAKARSNIERPYYLLIFCGVQCSFPLPSVHYSLWHRAQSERCADATFAPPGHPLTSPVARPTQRTRHSSPDARPAMIPRHSRKASTHATKKAIVPARCERIGYSEGGERIRSGAIPIRLDPEIARNRLGGMQIRASRPIGSIANRHRRDVLHLAPLRQTKHVTEKHE